MTCAVLDRPLPTTTDDPLDKAIYVLQRVEENLLADIRTLAEFHRVKVPLYITQLFRPLIAEKMEEMAEIIRKRKEAERKGPPDLGHNRRKS